MKTKIILPLVGCLLFVMITNFSFSQATNNNKDLNNTVATSVSHEIPNSGNASVTINRKIQKSFSGYFAGITGQNWSIAGNNFLTSFYTNGVQACALFDKYGDLIYAITYVQEKDMPSDIRKIVKSEYYDYTITLAVEVKQNERDIWIVNMKNDSTHLTVRLEDGEMELVREFKTP